MTIQFQQIAEMFMICCLTGQTETENYIFFL